MLQLNGHKQWIDEHYTIHNSNKVSNGGLIANLLFMTLHSCVCLLSEYIGEACNNYASGIFVLN